MKNSKRRLRSLILPSLMIIIALLSLSMVACTKPPETQSYKITYSTENSSYGSVSGTCTSGDKVEKGKSVTLTATPADEYSFTGWYVENTLKSNVNPYTFSVSEEISLTAKFQYVGHVCAYNEHVSYSKYEDEENEEFMIYRTMKCSCGQTQTAEFTDYTVVSNNWTLLNALKSTGQKDRLIVLDNGWPFDLLDLDLEYLDENLTIIGKEGASIKGININSKKTLEDANAATDVMPSGVTIISVKFTKDLQVINCSMNKFTIKDCNFIDGAGINARANSFDGVDAPGEWKDRTESQINKISNLTIEKCVFSGSDSVVAHNDQKTKIYAFDVDGVTIKDCNISTCEYNAIQLNQQKLDGVYGNIVIEGNEISDTIDRAIRITNIKGNITIKNNAFSYITSSSSDNAGEVIKATSKVSTTVVVFTGNTLDSQPLTLDGVKVQGLN